MKRVFFYVQHLLGIGHLRRAATLARVLADGGFDVLLVSGGAPVPLDLGRARLHQLPPLRAQDDGLRQLARVDGHPFDDEFRDVRARELVALLAAEQPAILITEQFPFGRTQLRFELLPLIEAARAMTPRPLIVSSVRDVVRRTASPQRVAETVEIFSAFDLALIHGDPKLVPFGDSFAAWDRIAARTAYTGYVAPDEQAPGTSDIGRHEVIVSAGGGAVGAALFKAAIEARPKCRLSGRNWRLLIGDNLPEAERLRLGASEGIVIEPARRDFTTLLGNSTLSISQAGYNTVIETLRFADRAVLVPFTTPRETEQGDRARLLAERGFVVTTPAETLSGDSLAEAIDRALAGPSIRSLPPCDARGATMTVEVLKARVS